MTFKVLSEQRFSVRSYTDEPVSEEQLNYVLECARLAPSAVNYQPWHFYVVKSEQQKENLRKWLLSLPENEEAAVLIPIGHPAVEPRSTSGRLLPKGRKKEKSRKAIEEIVSYL